MATRVTNCEKAESERHVCEKAIYFFGIVVRRKEEEFTWYASLPCVCNVSFIEFIPMNSIFLFIYMNLVKYCILMM